MHYQLLPNLPMVPQELIDATLNLIDKQDLLYYLNSVSRPISSLNKKFPRTMLHPDLETWLRNNIIDGANKYELAITLDDNDAHSILPHTDRAREYTIIYLLQSGGEDHKTVFYESKTIKNIDKMMTFDYSDLIEVDSIVVPIEKWTILNAQEIHSVENIPHTRIAIQISMDHNPWAS